MSTFTSIIYACRVWLVQTVEMDVASRKKKKKNTETD